MLFLKLITWSNTMAIIQRIWLTKTKPIHFLPSCWLVLRIKLHIIKCPPLQSVLKWYCINCNVCINSARLCHQCLQTTDLSLVLNPYSSQNDNISNSFTCAISGGVTKLTMIILLFPSNVEVFYLHTIACPGTENLAAFMPRNACRRFSKSSSEMFGFWMAEKATVYTIGCHRS